MYTRIYKDITTYNMIWVVLKLTSISKHKLQQNLKFTSTNNICRSNSI